MASDLDTPLRMDILTMGVVIHIRTTDIQDPGSTSDRHFIGTAVIAFTIRGRTIDTITGAGNTREPGNFEPAGKSPAGFYFFGDADPAGTDVD